MQDEQITEIVPSDLKDKMARWSANSQSTQQTRILQELVQTMQTVALAFNEAGRQNQASTDGISGLSSQLEGALNNLKSIKAPKIPDASTPIVAAVESLKTELQAAINGLDLKPNIKPQVNVAAPNVSVSPQVDVDLSGVERVLRKELPDAFSKAIKSMPEITVPETDMSEVVSKLSTVVDWLESIDATSRIKPQSPSTVKVTNVDGSPVGGSTGSASIATGQITVTTSTTQIVSGRTGRSSVTVTMIGTTDLYIGNISVTTSTGTLLVGVKGASFTLNTSSAIYGIVGTGSVLISFEEEY